MLRFEESSVQRLDAVLQRAAAMAASTDASRDAPMDAVTEEGQEALLEMLLEVRKQQLEGEITEFAQCVTVLKQRRERKAL